MLIGNLMTYQPKTLSSKDTVQTAAAMMKGGGFRRLPIVEDDRLIGIITDRDIRKHLDHADSLTIGEVMTTELKTMTPRMSVEDAARLMIKHKIDGLPVMDDGKLVGIVTTTDVMKAFLRVEAGVQSIEED
jgi:acetoin utilization protein AcuB